MKRYRLALLAVGFGALGALFAGRPVDAQPAPEVAGRSLSLATLAPAGSTWMRVLEAWNRELRRRTNKALSLRIYPGGVQGDESEVVRKIRAGRLDAGSVTAVGLAQVHRPALVFQMPGMFRSYAQLDAARAGTHDDIVHAFDAAGFAFMGWADVGFGRIFSRVPIRTPNDMRDTHPYVWRDDLVMPSFYEEAHVHPVAMQLPEVLTALQTNRVDSFITSPVAAVSLQWTTRATHMLDLPTNVIVGATIFGKNQLNSLPADQQAILRETATQFHQLLIRNLRSDETAAIHSIGTRGITVNTVGEPERAQWNELFAHTRARLVGRIADAAFISRVEHLAH